MLGGNPTARPQDTGIELIKRPVVTGLQAHKLDQVPFHKLRIHISCGHDIGRPFGFVGIGQVGQVVSPTVLLRRLETFTADLEQGNHSNPRTLVERHRQPLQVAENFVEPFGGAGVSVSGSHQTRMVHNNGGDSGILRVQQFGFRLQIVDVEVGLVGVMHFHMD